MTSLCFQSERIQLILNGDDWRKRRVCQVGCYLLQQIVLRKEMSVKRSSKQLVLARREPYAQYSIFWFGFFYLIRKHDQCRVKK